MGTNGVSCDFKRSGVEGGLGDYNVRAHTHTHTHRIDSWNNSRPSLAYSPTVCNLLTISRKTALCLIGASPVKYFPSAASGVSLNHLAPFWEFTLYTFCCLMSYLCSWVWLVYTGQERPNKRFFKLKVLCQIVMCLGDMDSQLHLDSPKNHKP